MRPSFSKATKGPRDQWRQDRAERIPWIKAAQEKSQMASSAQKTETEDEIGIKKRMAEVMRFCESP